MKHACIPKHTTTTKLTHKNLKLGLVAFYDVRPGNRKGLFSKNWKSKKVNKEVKKVSGEVK